jgi:triacylglycerol esterase/lipase EstA (alpha/beta hydrolase family)
VRSWRGASLAALIAGLLGTPAAIVAGLASAGTAAADSDPYAPLNRPGPSLSVPASKLRAALSCTRGAAHARRNPILLVPGTNLDPSSNYSWNYERAFTALHWPYCTVTLPYHTMGDIQVAGEYIVYALRTMAAIAGPARGPVSPSAGLHPTKRAASRQVDILGYSQGGMLPRWAFRFWPDTRRLVRTFVAIDPSNHGTLDANAACAHQCPPADWQQAAGSHFMDALNSRTETFSGIDYTVIYSRTDEIVVPNLDASGSSSLHAGKGRILNIAVQQICPNDASEHLAMGSYDPVAYALAVDAFSHEGLADPARIPTSVCAEPFQPGVDPSTFATDYAGYLQAIGQAEAQAPEVSAEPPLKCYVLASCRASSTPSSPHRRHAHKRRHKRPDPDHDGDRD